MVRSACRHSWCKSGKEARPRTPSARGAARGKGPGGCRAALPSAPRGQGSGQRTQWAAPASPQRTCTSGARGLELPRAANHPANISNLRTARAPGAHARRGQPLVPELPPSAQNLGLASTGAAQDGHQLIRALRRGVGGGPPVPNTHRANPAPSPVQPHRHAARVHAGGWRSER